VCARARRQQDARIARASIARRTVSRVALAASLVALVLLPAVAANSAQLRGHVSSKNPAHDLVPAPNFDNCTALGVCTEGPPCYTAALAAAFTAVDCEHEELAAIDNARTKEGVGPMYLPLGFNSLSGVEQLLVVIDLERVARGLTPFVGIAASLDSVAQGGAQVSGEPAGTFADPVFPARFSIGHGSVFAYHCSETQAQGIRCDGSGNPGAAIAAGSNISALEADYGWMYNDGYGGPNSACSTPKAAACWGHRDDILGGYPTRTKFISGPWGSTVSTVSARRAVPVMGAGWVEPNGSGGPQGNWTAIFTSVTGKTPRLAYTWKQALADGAGKAAG
jgi:hypothetical protein